MHVALTDASGKALFNRPDSRGAVNAPSRSFHILITSLLFTELSRSHSFYARPVFELNQLFILVFYFRRLIKTIVCDFCLKPWPSFWISRTKIFCERWWVVLFWDIWSCWKITKNKKKRKQIVKLRSIDNISIFISASDGIRTLDPSNARLTSLIVFHISNHTKSLERFSFQNVSLISMPPTIDCNEDARDRVGEKLLLFVMFI